MGLAGCGNDASTEPTEVLASTPTPDPVAIRDAAVGKIYAAAKHRDEAALTAARDDIVKARGTPDPAIALALYTIDRDKYKDAFVAAYPTDFPGVDLDYGVRLVKAGLGGGPKFPIAALGSIAVRGDTVAQQHLIAAMTVARGPLAATYAREVGNDLSHLDPGETLAALTAMPVPARLAATAETDWCHRKMGPLLSYAPTPTPVPSGVSPAPSVLATATAPVPGASATPEPLYAVEQHQIRDMLPYCAIAAEPRHRAKAKRRHRNGGRPAKHDTPNAGGH